MSVSNNLVAKGIAALTKLANSIRPDPVYALTGAAIMAAAIATFEGISFRDTLDIVAGPAAVFGIAIVMLGIYRLRASVDYKAAGNISPEAYLFLSLGIALAMGSVVGKIIILDVPVGSIRMSGLGVL